MSITDQPRQWELTMISIDSVFRRSVTLGASWFRVGEDVSFNSALSVPAADIFNLKAESQTDVNILSKGVSNRNVQGCGR